MKKAKNTHVNSIDIPIEQRNTGKGNPNAVLTFGVELNNRQKKLLEVLTEFDSRVIVLKKSVKMTDLSALTASFGDQIILRCFSQEISAVYNSKGQYLTFRKE